ncbi:MAG: DNA polymerase III subunit delta [Clostridia bacterium]|nr:DNA polymerase III subunit delta [Clostridia bacterium]
MEPKDLDRQLASGKIARLLFFYGDEQFLLENKIKSIKKRLIDKDFEDFNFVKLDGKKITAAQIEREILSVPVMADHKLLVVSGCGIFGNAKTKDFTTLQELLSDIPDYMTVIFSEREFDKKKEKNLEVFKKHGAIVKFDPLSPKQLELWLEKLFEEKGKTVLASDLSKMVALCGQSMSTVYSEFCKVLSYVGDRQKVLGEDISAVVSKTIDARIFDIIDNIAEGRCSTVFEELNALRSSGENSSTVLSLISTRMGELLMIKQLTDDRLSVERIAEYFEPRKHPFVVKKLAEQSRRFSVSYLKKMTLKGAEYTFSVRSGLLDKWIAVEMYAAELLKK